jgi:hypothetical protein
MSLVPDPDRTPADPGPLLWWVLGLLGAALLLEVYLAGSWTRPLTEPGNAVLVAVVVGIGLRLAGRHGARTDRTRRWLRGASLALWAAAAAAGLLAWLL